VCVCVWLGGLLFRALDLRLDCRERRVRFPAAAAIVLGWVAVFGRANHLGISPKPLRLTQPSTLRRTGNEYRSNCGDALRWGLKAGWLIPLVDKRVG